MKSVLQSVWFEVTESDGDGVCNVKSRSVEEDSPVCRWEYWPSNVYWTVHHRNSWRTKDQLDVTCYFISLLMCSTYFGHYYIHHQELATVLLNYHIGHLVLSSLCVGDLVWLGFSCARVAGWSTRVVLQPATRALLKPSHTNSPVHNRSCASACNTSTTQTQPHQFSNTQQELCFSL